MASAGLCSRKPLAVRLPDVLSQSRGRRKAKREIQLLSGFCSFEGRGFTLQTQLSALKRVRVSRGQGALLESDLIDDDAELKVLFFALWETRKTRQVVPCV